MMSVNQSFRQAANSPASHEAAETAKSIGEEVRDCAGDVGRMARKQYGRAQDMASRDLCRDEAQPIAHAWNCALNWLRIRRANRRQALTQSHRRSLSLMTVNERIAFGPKALSRFTHIVEEVAVELGDNGVLRIHRNAHKAGQKLFGLGRFWWTDTQIKQLLLRALRNEASASRITRP
jgi:hypothetical protein